MTGKGWMLEGLSSESYQIEYQRKDDCYSHETLDEVVELNWQSDQSTARMIFDEAERLFGSKVDLELQRETFAGFICPKCGVKEDLFLSLGRITVEHAFCPDCPGTMRQARTFHRLCGGDSFSDLPLADIGLPPFDIFSARIGDRSIGFELSGDAPRVLGTLLGDATEVDCT